MRFIMVMPWWETLLSFSSSFLPCCIVLHSRGATFESSESRYSQMIPRLKLDEKIASRRVYNSIYLFVDQFPKHQGSIGTADSNDVLIVVEKSGAGYQWAVNFFLDIFSFGTGARISEEPKVPFGVTAYQHIVRCGSTGGSDHCSQWIITVVPLT